MTPNGEASIQVHRAGSVDPPYPVHEAVDPVVQEEEMKRHKMSRGHSKHHFSKHASYTHKKNVPTRLPMRGGIRL